MAVRLMTLVENSTTTEHLPAEARNHILPNQLAYQFSSNLTDDDETRSVRTKDFIS